MDGPRVMARDVVSVSNHLFYLVDIPENASPSPSLEGPIRFANGLVLTEPGVSAITTGIADGPAEVTVELYETRVPVRIGWWNEVVEISRETPHDRVIVSPLDAYPPKSLPNLAFQGAGPYRIRIHARGRDNAIDLAVFKPVEQYLLQVWPAPTAPERIYKQTDEYGAAIRRSARLS